MDVALESGVKDIVFTSSGGVYGPSIQGVVTERTLRLIDYFSEYERTKAIAEQMLREYVSNYNLNIRIVNPARVYGPGTLDDCNSIVRMISLFLKGYWRIIPGDGKGIGSYVYVDDIVKGHILAMERGKAGENYLLGGENVSYDELFKCISAVSGQKRYMINFPLGLMLLVADFAHFLNVAFGIRPIITQGLTKKYTYNWEVSSYKAISELGYSFLPLEDGISRTIAWLRRNGL